MNKEELIKLIQEKKLDVSIPKKVQNLNESFTRYMEENKKSIDEVVQLEIISGGSYALEKFQLTEDVNEATKMKIEKVKKKYEGQEGIYISVLSKANATTQNRTLYPYEACQNGLKDKTFKRRLKDKEVLMHADHPDWFINTESVLNECAVLREFIWEEIDGDPTVTNPALDPTTKKHGKKFKAESNGKPMIRLYGVFQLFGKHKEHLEDYIDKARLGISSRGYGIGERVYDEAENFLYYEMQAIQWETWDFVTRPSVEDASFTIDGEINTQDESLKEDKKEEIGKTESETYNVGEKNRSETEASTDKNPTEGNTMEEFLKFLKTPEGQAHIEKLIQERLDAVKESKENKDVKVELEALKETHEATNTELNSLKSINEKIIAENKELLSKVTAIETAKFESHKEDIFSKYTEKFANDLKEDTQDCKDIESFDKLVEKFVKYFPESASVDYSEPTSEPTEKPETEEVETKEPTKEGKKEENKPSDQYSKMIEKSNSIFNK